MADEKQFDIFSVPGQNVKEVTIAKIEFYEAYIKIIKEFIADEERDGEIGKEQFPDSYIYTETIIFKDSFTDIDFKTSYAFVGSEYMYQLAINSFGMYRSILEFKKKKEVVAMRDKIVNWKLNRE